MKQRMFKLLMMIATLLLSSALAFGTGGLNVILSSQNPDPVSPGSFVYLNVKVSNPGSSDLRSVSITALENENFKLASGSERTRNLGVIPGFSTGSDAHNFVIAKYKMEVSQGTPLGLNTVAFEIDYDGNKIRYEFDVLVEDLNPRLRIYSFNLETLEAGSQGVLEIELVNENNVALKNIELSLGLDEVENRVLSTRSGSNQKTIASLAPGERTKISFNMVASPDATSKPYLLPLNIKYRDALNNDFTTNALGSARIYSTPLISLRMDSQEIYSVGRGRMTFAIANPGTSTIKGAQLEILEGEGYEVVEGRFQYIGNLNPDDFQTIQSQISINSAELEYIRARVTYLDSYNREMESVIDVAVNIYSADELKSLGLSGSNAGSSVFNYILVLILIGAAFIFGRKIGFKKGRSKSN